MSSNIGEALIEISGISTNNKIEQDLSGYSSSNMNNRLNFRITIFPKVDEIIEIDEIKEKLENIAENTGTEIQIKNISTIRNIDEDNYNSDGVCIPRCLYWYYIIDLSINT